MPTKVKVSVLDNSEFWSRWEADESQEAPTLAQQSEDVWYVQEPSDRKKEAER